MLLHWPSQGSSLVSQYTRQYIDEQVKLGHRRNTRGTVEMMRRASLHIAAELCVLVATSALLCVAQLPVACGASTKAELNVRSYGATGNGKTDDTAAFVKAMRAAAKSRQRLFVPAGVYRVGRLSMPNGVSLKGAGRRTTWLKGRLDFGSNEHISGLKIGPASATNCAVHNLSGATNTVFAGCHFRGGGGEPGWVKSPVVSLGANAQLLAHHLPQLRRGAQPGSRQQL